MNAPAFELVLRILVAVVSTAVTILIAHGLYRGSLTPRILWAYAGAVTSFVAIWRWGLVWLGLQTGLPHEHAPLLAWVQPINAATLTVVVFTLGLLALANIRGMR